METEFVTVFVTSPGRETSLAIASALVEERIAACVNVVPGLVSVYRWEGKVQQDPEELLVAKTRRSLLGNLEERVKALHPYDVPEVVALPILDGSREYLDWLAESTAPPEG
ncbi:MAG: divalent-cation tolerance protein CutA [Planctomycetota bacterium]